ncbi:hypothetical protein BDN72DRAFT_304629 [Pluteus cervinus]|uniref:Uncharacterized protein n=1 Tax=Pluteus cervinus TaxID=181527 RepID=A0ACD3B4T7_9AGAR|nr:hypothetical protein BDN72DRAFT_304629 [Pluteus cervinus]
MAVAVASYIPLIRIGLYVALALFSFITFALCAARLHYTLHIPIGDPLNGGVDFYDPVVAELLFTTLITMPFCLYAAFSIHSRYENKYVGTFAAEIALLVVLWLFWIGGAAVATEFWGDLSFCQQFQPCRILTAMVAFTWLSWVVLTGIIMLSLMFSLANRAWMEPLHGRWDPRASHYHA